MDPVGSGWFPKPCTGARQEAMFSGRCRRFRHSTRIPGLPRGRLFDGAAAEK